MGWNIKLSPNYSDYRFFLIEDATDIEGNDRWEAYVYPVALPEYDNCIFLEAGQHGQLDPWEPGETMYGPTIPAGWDEGHECHIMPNDKAMTLAQGRDALLALGFEEGSDEDEDEYDDY